MIIVCSAIIVFDSTIVAIYANLRIEPTILTNESIFVGLAVFFAIVNYVLLSQSGTRYLYGGSGKNRFPKLLHLVVVTNQIAITMLVTIIVIELVVTNELTFVSVWLATNLSFGLGIICTAILCFKFFVWFESQRKFVVFLYVIAFSSLTVYLLVSLTLLNIEFSYSDPTIRERSIKRQIADASNTLLNQPWVADAYNYLTIITFVSMWSAAVMQLKTYSSRLGKSKYWGLVTVPLLYFLLPFIADQFGIFENLRIEYGMQFQFVYVIVVSPYRQIGGLLFGIVFWLAAKEFKRDNLRFFMFLSGVGMILIFNATAIHDLTYVLAPPFGIITLLFAGIASYFLLIGIYATSKELARDAVIRTELYRVAEKENSLLKYLGPAQTQKDIERRLKPILKKTLSIELEDIELHGNEDYEEMIREVINELAASKKNKGSNN
jgi:hypothetical protein